LIAREIRHMQIAGSSCKVCGRKIVFSNEGKFCVRCTTVVHIACDPRTECGVCGQPFQQYEPPRPDPVGDAVLPRALRSGRSGPLIFAILLMVMFAILAFYFYYGMLMTHD
jgi:hypothetical protein